MSNGTKTTIAILMLIAVGAGFLFTNLHTFSGP
jgi:hypothetical protein